MTLGQKACNPITPEDDAQNTVDVHPLNIQCAMDNEHIQESYDVWVIPLFTVVLIGGLLELPGWEKLIALPIAYGVTSGFMHITGAEVLRGGM